jgi:6-pyruvoyltetrahydropterin/6-carboxytetrahydropterin synthase
MIATVCRKATFNSAHRLHNPEWDEKTNKEIFGLCNNPNYHGHNYSLYVYITGEINKNTGYVVDMKWLAALIKNEIEEKFDHKNLNLDCSEFAHLNPTAENIAVVIWNILRKKIDVKFKLKIVLYETERNFVEYCGE